MNKALFVTISFFTLFLTGACLYAQQSFQLQFPVKCQINKNCWILNYVDDDSASNWHDYKGGRQTYEGHTGTDIAIKNISQMKQGVDVLAAASGLVVATRDGVADKNALAQNINQLQNSGCGNRVAIKHSNGWITDYCHMKNGSIRVKKGAFVKAGQPLGQIGLSGLTEFPHLHLNVQQNNQFIDPFTGLERYTQGNRLPLWAPNVLQLLRYKPIVIYNVGVSSEIPKVLDIRNEKYKTNRIDSNADMLLVWLDMFHVEVGDSIDVLIKNPNDNVYFFKKIVIDKSNARKLLYLGKKKPTNGFTKGIYSVQISFIRPNKKINENKSFSFIIN